MSTPPLSDEMALEALDAYYRNGRNKTDAARDLGIPVTTYRHRLATAIKRGLDRPAGHIPDGFEIRKHGVSLDADGNIKGETLVSGPSHGEAFEIPEGHRVKGVSALTDADGRIVQQWLKTGAEQENRQALVEAIKAEFEDHESKAPSIPRPSVCEPDLLSVYPIADQHHGLLSWAPESGEHYDINIGIERLRTSMRDLIAQSPASETALILNLGDFYHADDSTNETPASRHRLDVDGRYVKVLRSGVRLMMDCIDMALERHGSVIVRNLPGNHDPHASATLTIALDAFYRANDRVVVDDDPSEFFFHRFGVTLIGAHHGHRIKPDRMALLLADKRPEDWGQSRHRWFLFGHIHHSTVKDVGTVRCESFQTLAAKDAYSAGAGYTSPQSLSSITLHRDRGEIGRHKVTIF